MYIPFLASFTLSSSILSRIFDISLCLFILDFGSGFFIMIIRSMSLVGLKSPLATDPNTAIDIILSLNSFSRLFTNFTIRLLYGSFIFCISSLFNVMLH